MNKTLLQINTSLFSDAGTSSVLANEFVAGWKKRNPAATVIVRDLAKEPVPHLTAERFQAFITKPGERDAGQRAEAAFSDALIDEMKRADVIVFGVPMYNFDVPSTLKAYFDHIARAGVTFRYTEQGPVGQLTGKKVYVFASRGGSVCRQSAGYAERVLEKLPRAARHHGHRIRLRGRSRHQRGEQRGCARAGEASGHAVERTHASTAGGVRATCKIATSHAYRPIGSHKENAS